MVVVLVLVTIQMDDLCAVQSDKATVEITSPYTGKVVKLHQKEGTMVKIGSPLLDIDVEGDEDEAEESPKTEEKQSSVSRLFPTLLLLLLSFQLFFSTLCLAVSRVGLCCLSGYQPLFLVVCRH